MKDVNFQKPGIVNIMIFLTRHISPHINLTNLQIYIIL